MTKKKYRPCITPEQREARLVLLKERHAFLKGETFYSGAENIPKGARKELGAYVTSLGIVGLVHGNPSSLNSRDLLREEESSSEFFRQINDFRDSPSSVL
jgi:hypothetical protein